MKKSIKVIDGKNILIVNIEVDKYFSITGDYFEPITKRNAEKNGYLDTKIINGKIYELTRGGCIHEIISKLRPDLNPLIALHLSDVTGLPMYALENGYYHLEGYMGTAAYNHTMTKKGVADYLRITEKEVETLARTGVSKVDFSKFIISKLDLYKKQAIEAIEFIETL